MLGVDRRLSLTLPNINSPVASSLRSSWYSSGFLFLQKDRENLIRRCYRLMRFLTCTSHGVVHCTSKNQINQEQLQEKCRREVGVMLISVRTQLPDDIKVQIKGEVVRELCPKDEGVVVTVS